VSRAHHTISDAGMIDGGHVPMLGELSKAHHGIFFLGERLACRRHVLEGLRQPQGAGTRLDMISRPARTFQP
jgi:magnesium chelatase family protein